MKSKFGRLNWKDVFRGCIMAAGTSVLLSVATILNSGSFPTWTQVTAILMSGLAAGIFYLVKNIVTNSNDKLLKGESNV